MKPSAQRARQRTALSNFELSSTLLFAGLALAWGTSVQAQAQPHTQTPLHTQAQSQMQAPQQAAPQPRPPLPRPVTPFTGGAGAATAPADSQGAAAAPAHNPFRPTPSAQAAMTAFDRADTNHDGVLSAREAALLPAMAQRFKELDTDRNGTLSRAEFDKGARY